jgi:hypothetical protein
MFQDILIIQFISLNNLKNMNKLKLIIGILTLAIAGTIFSFTYQDNTLGTSTRTKAVYLDRENTFTENNTFSKGVYGVNKLYFGDSSDGAISTSTGTTTLDLLGQQFPVFNFSSISLTGDAKIAFTNPHPAGSVITINVAGNVVASSTADGVIDLRGLGSTVATTTGALDALDHRASTVYSYPAFYANNVNKNISYIKEPFVSAGTKGQDGEAGTGGLGAGGLIMKITGNLTGTSTILANGGSVATSTGTCRATTAGGGSGSDVYIAYKGTYTGNITINNRGGDGQNKFETGSASGCNATNSPTGAGSSVAAGGGVTLSEDTGLNASGLKAGGGGISRCDFGFCSSSVYATRGLGGASDGGVIIKIE